MYANIIPDCVFLGRNLSRSRSYAATFLCILVGGPAVFAQMLGTIHGVVRDAQTLKTLTAASVSIRDRVDSSESVLGDICDNDGGFEIGRVIVGRDYTLHIRHVGYRADSGRTIRIERGTTGLDLGDIMLRQDSVTTRDVVVTEKRPDVAVMADKTVYAVEQSGAYTATNVSELLGQIPSVFVDQDGNISLRGDNNVQIMMNGRPLNMPTDQRNKFLQSLPMSMVKDIEVRTTPGAQFDAKSSAGIINIITKRGLSDMLGGTVNASANSRVSANANLGLYYNDEGVSASLSGGLSYGKSSGSNTYKRINYLDILARRDEGASTSETIHGSRHIYGQIDYNITNKDVLSGYFYGSKWDYDRIALGYRSFYDANNNLTETFNDVSERGEAAGNEGRDRSASVLFKHSFQEDHKISFDATYEDDSFLSDNHYQGNYKNDVGAIDSSRSVDRSTLFDQKSSAVNLKLDYENLINDALTLSFGAKNEIEWAERNTLVSDLDRSLGSRVIDSLRSNHYLPENTTYAAYGNASYRPIKELGLQFGLRIEHASVSATYASGEHVVDRTYLNVFPSGSIAVSFSEEASLTLSYRRSVSLPDIESLNPLRVRWGEFWESSGNPDLRPEIVHSINLNYSMFWGKGNMWSVAPFFSTTTNNIENSEQLNNGLTTSTSANFNGNNRYGGSTSIRLRPLPWLNLDASADVYTTVNRGGTVPGDFYSSGTGYSVHGSVVFDLAEDLTWRVSAENYKPATIGATQAGGYTSIRTLVRQRLFDDKLTITASVNDPFDMQRSQRSYDSPAFRTESASRWVSRYAGIDVTYSFGTTPRMEEHDIKQGSGPRE